jgi:subtilase family serine protease
MFNAPPRAAATTTIGTASLPDLAVTSITPPVDPLVGQSDVPVTWLVTNDGNVPSAVLAVPRGLTTAAPIHRVGRVSIAEAAYPYIEPEDGKVAHTLNKNGP